MCKSPNRKLLGSCSDRQIARYLADPVIFSCEQLLWTPDEQQMEILSAPNSRIALNWARQTGKSSVLAAKAAHMLILRPETVVLIVADRMAHVEETVYKMDRLFAALNIRTRNEAGKKLSRVLPNHSRVISLAADEGAVRSFTAHMVIIDEAARVPPEVWDSIEPTLATTNGPLFICGTPEGCRGPFWEICVKPGPEWLVSRRTIHECPRIAKEFIELQRRTKGEQMFKQEYECQFVESGRHLLGRPDIERILDNTEPM